MTLKDDFGLVLEMFGKAFVPERVRPGIRAHFQKAGIYVIPYKLFGLLFLLSVSITSALYKLAWSTFKGYAVFKLVFSTFLFWAIVGGAAAALMIAVVYIWIDVQIFRRTRAMEGVLSDFLTVMSENLRAGMTVDRALWKAVKPEFGVLSAEIKIASKKVMTGQDVDTVLRELTEKYDSPMMKRAFGLIIEAIKAGGEIAEIIDRTVENIRQNNILKEKMMANAVQFTIFISFIVMVIAPGLFALAYNLLVMIQAFGAKLTVAGATAGGAASTFLSFGGVAVALDDFKFFSQLCITIIGFFAAMIVSSISKGDIKSGLKYVPTFVLVGLLVYTFLLKTLLAIFGGLV
ncbi:type II secretion system F family protein [Candidatus Woesearchaeota archaeon]|nr:type II secretion system F family protein [Candidatus Woesearchaeota archaeon]